MLLNLFQQVLSALSLARSQCQCRGLTNSSQQQHKDGKISKDGHISLLQQQKDGNFSGHRQEKDKSSSVIQPRAGSLPNGNLTNFLSEEDKSRRFPHYNSGSLPRGHSCSWPHSNSCSSLPHSNSCSSPHGNSCRQSQSLGDYSSLPHGNSCSLPHSNSSSLPQDKDSRFLRGKSCSLPHGNSCCLTHKDRISCYLQEGVERSSFLAQLFKARRKNGPEDQLSDLGNR
jgi:hypothetical protein